MASTLTKNRPVLDSSATVQLTAKDASNFRDLWQIADRVKKMVSRELVDSELSNINRSRTQQVSEDLIALIQRSLKFHKSTSGYFNCAIGTKDQDVVPGKALLAKKPSELIEIVGTTVSLKDELVILDMEKLKEGFLVDEMAKLLVNRRVVAGTVKVGNSVRCMADCKIEISNPFKPTEKWAVIHSRVENLAISSYNYKRSYLQESETKKLVNPKSGKNIHKYAGVTVLTTADNTKASAFAAAIFYMPEKKISEVLSQYPNMAFILVHANGEVRTSANLFSFVRTFRMAPESWLEE